MIYPSEWVKNFPTDEHFKDWLRGCIINDLKAILKHFEEAEMYEHAQMIQDVIDEKVDAMLEGFGFE